ncbi:MAG: hypothetical protein ACLSVP_08360, partial [Fusobacterium sp.]
AFFRKLFILSKSGTSILCSTKGVTNFSSSNKAFIFSNVSSLEESTNSLISSFFKILLTWEYVNKAITGFTLSSTDLNISQ